MSLARNRLARHSSWLSLFAMLMIFIGPLVSQSMPMDHRASMPDMGMDGMAMSMDGAADCHGARPVHSGHGSEPSLHALWEKCGYCSLFFHCPALPQPLSLLTTQATPARHTLRVQPRHGHARQSVFPGARSRAPPTFHVV